MKFGILDIDSRPIVRDTLAPLAQYGTVLYPDMKSPDFVKQLQDVDILIIRLYTVDRALLEQLPNLKAVIKAGVGVDHIDVETATRLGIHVNISPGNHISVAETAILLMLATARNLPYLNRNVRPDMARLGVELYGKKLGLIGAGRIGMHVAQIARGLGMEVVFHDPYASDKIKAATDCRFVELDELLCASDVVSLHCPLTPDTHHLLDEKAFAKMKTGAIVINTARGPVLDEKALIDAINSGKIAGAGLDVVESEPLKEDNPLLKVDNIIVTPHRLIQTTESLVRQTQSILDSAIAYSKGTIPDTAINAGKISASCSRF